MIKNTFLIVIAGIAIFTIEGCADIKTPTTGYALTHPLSTKTMVSPGTSKSEVRETWGEPSEVIDMGVDEAGLKKESWIYNAWFEKTPLDYRHFSRKKKINFAGESVTGYEDIEDAK